PAAAAGPDHAAYVIYTSGSTGRPKGVVTTHRAICNRLLWMQDAYRLGAADRVLQKTPLGFDVSVWELFWPLLAGARLVMARPDGHRDSAYLVDAIARHRITTLHFVPSMLRVFLEERALGRCTSLRRVICSGEALPPEVQDRCLRALGAELHNLYGPTEAAIDVTAWRCRPGDPTVPIGWPIRNLQVHVLDPHGHPAPIGVPGELYLGGVGLARGYLDRPRLTAASFVPDPSGRTPGGRLYRTGDVVRQRPDGALVFLGRRDRQVKLRGHRIELGEVEAALCRHPGVAAAAAIVRDEALVAYVVGRQPPPSAAELRAHLRAQLPEPMIPAAFVPLDHLPTTPSGKLDPAALPPAAAASPGEPFVAPRTPTEELVAGIWGRLLGRGTVSARGHFFELGGHSLLATQAAGMLRELFRIELPLRDLFEAPVVAELAARIDAARRSSAGSARPPLAPVARAAPLPLSFAQEAFWELERVVPGSAYFNMPVALALRGPLDAPALARSLTEIVRRHEVLRTRFVHEGGASFQVIDPAAEIALPIT
ncbi:MAG TPA: amino acid adenylation domain-containing protein, partial [Miltoncostaeaceae bacterium]|nr:amino acid adenylation domain-containing protein [Miltoncostaeaceae bacterium]